MINSLNLSDIDPLLLPSVALKKRWKLPELCCIYFVANSDNQILYVGKTKNLKKRWANHHIKPSLKLLQGIRLTYFECEAEKLSENEYFFIQKFKPPLNREFFSPEDYYFVENSQSSSPDDEIILIPFNEIKTIKWNSRRGENLTKLRKELSQAEFSDKVRGTGFSISRQYLHRLETDPNIQSISFDLLEVVCQVLGVEIGEILGLSCFTFAL